MIVTDWPTDCPPLRVLAGMRNDIKSEWDDLKQHDVLFLLSITPPDAATAFAAVQQGGYCALLTYLPACM